MKKIVSLLLIAALIMSMPLTAFAAASQSAEVTVTTVVPSASYVLIVPASIDIPYCSSAMEIDTEIARVEGFNEGDMVFMNVSWTDLYSGNDCIPMEVLVTTYEAGEKVVELVNPMKSEVQINQIAYLHGYEGYGVEYYAFVSPENWKAAVPGSYSATVYFDSSYWPAV